MLLTPIKAHVDAECSPLAWKRIVMRLLPQIREKGLFLHTFKGDIEIDNELVTAIDSALNELYNIGLPAELK
jgi:hypothetical protein